MKRLLALLLALAMVFALTACGSSDASSAAASSAAEASAEAEAPASEDTASGGKTAVVDVNPAPEAAAPSELPGTYKMTAINGDGEDSGPEEFAEMEALGIYYLLTVNEDGTGNLTVFDDVTELTWDDTSFYMDGEPVNYTYSNNELVLSDEEMSMTFVKLSDGELAAIQAAMTAPEEEVPVDSGYYEVTRMEVGDSSIGSNGLASQGITPDNTYIFLNDDNTGVIALFDGIEMDLILDSRFMIVNGEAVEYTLEDGMLTIIVPDDEGDVTLTFTRTGDTKPEPAAPAEEPAPAPPAPAGTASGLSGADLGDFHVEIVGAEAFEDIDGKDAIRIYYDFTNNSSEVTWAYWELDKEATQDGYELVDTFGLESYPEEYNDSKDIRPGVTIRCTEEYNFKPDGAPVVFTLSSSWGDGSLSVELDPQNLPGKPEAWTIDPITEPDWMDGVPTEGDIDGYHVKLTETTGGEDYSGNPMLRFFFEFTNNGEEAISAGSALYLRVMQDGIELDTTFSMEDLPEEDNWYGYDAAPGETVTVARTYELRTDSPVTIEFYDFMTDEAIVGTVVPVAE